MRPCAKCRCVKVFQQAFNRPTPHTIATGKGIGILGMRQVQSALTGQQKLAPDRGHSVKQMHGHAGIHQDLCSHQAGRSTADNGHRNREVHGVFNSINAPCAVKNAARTVRPGEAF